MNKNHNTKYKVIFIIFILVIFIVFLFINKRSDIKDMSTIEKKEIKGELKYKDTVIVTYKIEYPKMVGNRYKRGQEAFNKYNRNKAYLFEQYIKTDLFNDAKKTYDYNIANGYPVMVYEAILDYKITYNNNYALSLYYDEYLFTGGAHGNTKRTSQTWDLIKAKQIPLSYFFPNNQYYIIEIIRDINSQIKEQIENGSDIYFENYQELVIENFRTENYYINKDGVVIYFQQYDIGPYSSGIIEFNIKSSL